MKKLLVQLNPFVFARYKSSMGAECSALAWLRINYCHAGIVIPYLLRSKRPVFNSASWQIFAYRFLPLLKLEFWAYHGHNQFWMFRLTLFGFSAGFLTAGDRAGTDDPKGWVFDSNAV